MTAAPVRFDDSLRALLDGVAAELGEEAVSAGVALRDATGRLAFFVARRLDPETAARAASRLHSVLGPYARAERVLAHADDEGAAAILRDPSALRFRVGSRSIALLDRRLAGADWLRPPAGPAPGPPRFVFTSVKGGVGRSTALAVVAAHLATKGGRVLAVDLDLEAPGLGALLLSEDTVPEFGTLDFLVENNVQELDEPFFADLVGPSGLATQGGRIDVIPALGRRSLASPADVLAKLSRAYVEDLRSDGALATILDQIRELVDHFAKSGRYDAILVDARAGLHETTAASVLGLGAEVLLFGLDEPQTFQGYAALLAHLARLILPDAEPPEWLERLTPVQAKAPVDADRRAEFAQRWQSLVARWVPLSRAEPEPSQATPLPAGFKDVPWDDSAPDEDVLPADASLAQPIAVLRDDRYEAFDPLRRRDLLAHEVYEITFGGLLRRVERAVFPRAEGSA